MADNSVPPRTTDEFAAIVNRILKALIEGAAEDEVIALILASSSVFATPFIGWILTGLVKFFVRKFGTYFYETSAKIAAQIIVTIQADVENREVKQAAADLQQAIAGGNQDEIAKADQALQDAYGNLIHSDGAAPP